MDATEKSVILAEALRVMVKRTAEEAVRHQEETSKILDEVNEIVKKIE